MRLGSEKADTALDFLATTALPVAGVSLLSRGCEAEADFPFEGAISTVRAWLYYALSSKRVKYVNLGTYVRAV